MNNKPNKKNIVCPHCGNLHRIEAKFCPNTGKIIKASKKKQKLSKKRYPKAISTDISGTILYSKKEMENLDIKKNYPIKLCPYCKAELPSSHKSKFCNKCGKSLTKNIVKCPYPSCKGKISLSNGYCKECSRRIKICPKCKSINSVNQKICSSCKEPFLMFDTADWPMFKGSPPRTGNTRQTIGTELVLKWKYPEYKKAKKIISSPIVYRGMIYFGSTDEHIHALNQYSGNAVWKRPTKGIIISTPAVWDEIVYGASCDGKIYAQDWEKGKPIWTYPTKKSDNLGKISAPILTCNKGLFVGTDSGKIICLNLKNGEKKWEKNLNKNSLENEEYPFIGGITYNEELLFVNDRNGKLTCLKAKDGIIKWQFSKEEKLNSPFVSTPIFAAGNIYNVDRAGKVYAISEKENKDIWNFTVDLDGVVEGSPSLGLGKIIIGTQNEFLVAIDMYTGGECWRVKNNKIRLIDSIFSTPTITLNELVFTGSDSGYLYCRDLKSGKEVWKYKLESQIRSEPAISNKHIYITSSKGFLYAFCEKNILE